MGGIHFPLKIYKLQPRPRRSQAHGQEDVPVYKNVELQWVSGFTKQQSIAFFPDPQGHISPRPQHSTYDFPEPHGHFAFNFSYIVCAIMNISPPFIKYNLIFFDLYCREYNNYLILFSSIYRNVI